MEEAVSFLFCIGGRIESTYIDDKFWSERARMFVDSGGETELYHYHPCPSRLCT